MSDYLNCGRINEKNDRFFVENEFKPLKPKSSSWENSGEALKRVFEFEDRKQLESFVVEILKYNRETNADLVVTFSREEVSVSINALSGHVSEIEIEASRDLNKIRKDVVYYYAK